MSRDDRSYKRRDTNDYGSGYPRYEAERYVRDPYEERILREVDHANHPYAHRSLDSPPESRRFREAQRDRRPEPPPILTVTAPSEDQRRSVDPLERRGPYASYRRDSETPPPGPRASRDRVPRYQDEFGDLPAPSTSSSERLRYGPSGPSNTPFDRSDTIAETRPYGGRSPPRNPFIPGGSLYDQERSTGHRPRFLERGGRRVNDPEPAREDYYRGRVGEEWGLAEYEAYRGRRRHEERMRRN